MRGTPKNTIIILLSLAGLVLTGPSQTMPSVKQINTKIYPIPVTIQADQKNSSAQSPDTDISLDRARLEFACW